MSRRLARGTFALAALVLAAAPALGPQPSAAEARPDAGERAPAAAGPSQASPTESAAASYSVAESSVPQSSAAWSSAPPNGRPRSVTAPHQDLPGLVYLPALAQSGRQAFQVTGHVGGGPVTAAVVAAGGQVVAAAGPRLFLVGAALPPGGSPAPAATSPLTGTVVSLAVDGDRILGSVALDDERGELRVFDGLATGALRPGGRQAFAREFDTSGTVVAAGGQAWLALADGVAAFDLLGRGPRPGPTLAARGRPLALALDGRWLVAAEAAPAGNGFLEVADLAAPGGPRWVGWLALPVEPAELLLRGDLAFLAGGEGEPTRVVDLADRTAPRDLGPADAANVLRLFAGPGDWIYAEAKLQDTDEAPYQLRSFEVAAGDPTVWRFAGSRGLAEGMRLVAGGPGRLVEGGESGRLEILPAVPGVPQAAAGADLYGTVLGWAGVVAADERFLYAVDRRSRRLEVLRLPAADPRERPVGGIALPEGLDPVDAELARGVVYLVDSDSGLAALDVRDPSQPRLLGAWPAWPGAALAAEGGLVLVAARAGEAGAGLQAIDVSLPDRPLARGRLELDVVDVVLAGATAFVSGTCPEPDTAFPCLQTVGLGDPERPRLLASVKSQPGRSPPGAVTAAGGFAFVSQGEQPALRVFDVSNPANPLPAGTFADEVPADRPAGGPQWLAAGGERLFLADAFGLRVLDARRHVQPQREKRIALPTFGAQYLAVAGARAHVVGEDGVWLVERAGSP
jgi:hypothetical protein